MRENDALKVLDEVLEALSRVIDSSFKTNKSLSILSSLHNILRDDFKQLNERVKNLEDKQR